MNAEYLRISPAFSFSTSSPAVSSASAAAASSSENSGRLTAVGSCLVADSSSTPNAESISSTGSCFVASLEETTATTSTVVPSSSYQVTDSPFASFSIAALFSSEMSTICCPVTHVSTTLPSASTACIVAPVT